MADGLTLTQILREHVFRAVTRYVNKSCVNYVLFQAPSPRFEPISAI